MAYLADRVFETSTDTGTGALDLDGAETEYRDFVTALQEDTDEATGPWTDVPYYIWTEDGNGDVDEWEYGFGTITDGAPDTLTRTQVHYSSDGQETAVNWAAGTKYIKLVGIASNPSGIAISSTAPFWWLE